MINILISQIDEHNESNILATKEFNPEVVYLIKDKSYEDKVDTLKNYYENNFKNVKLELFNVEEGNNNRQCKRQEYNSKFNWWKKSKFINFIRYLLKNEN